MFRSIVAWKRCLHVHYRARRANIPAASRQRPGEARRPRVGVYPRLADDLFYSNGHKVAAAAVLQGSDRTPQRNHPKESVMFRKHLQLTVQLVAAATLAAGASGAALADDSSMSRLTGDSYAFLTIWTTAQVASTWHVRRKRCRKPRWRTC
jgi:hypothetical protein